MLENGASFAEVADWLNENGVSPGPYCRSAQWDGPMVGRVTRNPILKGVRERNNKMSQRVNRTGRRRSVNAPPEELPERHCSNLAFIEPGRYDRVVRLLRLRNSKYRRHTENGQDPRANISKKRTRWPGQHVYCGVCGRLYVYGRCARFRMIPLSRPKRATPVNRRIRVPLLCSGLTSTGRGGRWPVLGRENGPVLNRDQHTGAHNRRNNSTNA